MKKRIKSVYYSKYYTRIVTLDKLDPDDYIETSLQGPDLKGLSEADIEKMLPGYHNTYFGKLKGMVKKKDIENVKKKAKELGIYLFTEKRCFKTNSLPDGYLYSGKNTGIKTKITKEDLPDTYIEINDSHFPGYLKTDDVKVVVYRMYPFNNHAFKDDCFEIGYDTEAVPPKKGQLRTEEKVWGNDLINVICAIEKNSNLDPLIIQDIKNNMVEKYNRYCDEMQEKYGDASVKIENFDDLIRNT